MTCYGCGRRVTNKAALRDHLRATPQCSEKIELDRLFLRERELGSVEALIEDRRPYDPRRRH